MQGWLWQHANQHRRSEGGRGIRIGGYQCIGLGGVSLNGGIGRMRFVVAGVLIMGIVENAMNLKNIDSYYQNVVRGGILLAAVLFDRLNSAVATKAGIVLSQGSARHSRQQTRRHLS